jgi:preprotein translocase subunit SecA
LMDLTAVETIDAIRDAFRRDAVDSSLPGDLEDVEIEFGLRERRATPRPHYMMLPEDWARLPKEDRFQPHIDVLPKREKVGRNDPCPCGSGKKYKKCCL